MTQQYKLARRRKHFNVQRRGLSAEMIMQVTHNGKQYNASKLNDNEWQLSSVEKPREKITMNRWQMHIAGLLQQVEGKS